MSRENFAGERPIAVPLDQHFLDENSDRRIDRTDMWTKMYERMRDDHFAPGSSVSCIVVGLKVRIVLFIVGGDERMMESEKLVENDPRSEDVCFEITELSSEEFRRAEAICPARSGILVIERFH